ncbi:hypothetical protein C8T65DRAFT_584448, partial [Cerioporus squamosus]
QNVYDKRMVQLEDKIKNIQESIQETLRPVKRSYAEAEIDAFRKERRDLEAFKGQCEERLDTLQKSLTKAERDVTVLQSQWSVNKRALNQLGEQLAPTQASAASLTKRLAEMEEMEAEIWAALQETREGLHELRSSGSSESGSVGQS